MAGLDLREVEIGCRVPSLFPPGMYRGHHSDKGVLSYVRGAPVLREALFGVKPCPSWEQGEEFLRRCPSGGGWAIRGERGVSTGLASCRRLWPSGGSGRGSLRYRPWKMRGLPVGIPR